MTAVIVVLAVLVLVVVVALVLRAGGGNRRSVDDIDSFRRQIDALSPEARRQTSRWMKPTEPSSTGDDGDDDQ